MQAIVGLGRLCLVVLVGLAAAAPDVRADVIAAGAFHSCALTRSARVECWGRNDHGQLGDGTHVDRETPVVVPIEGEFIDVVVGASHTCALRSDGGVACWGFNGFGQLGNGTLVDAATPVNVIGLNSAVKAMAAGPVFTCARMTTGRVECWGDNSELELGNDAPNLPFSATPVDVAFDAGIDVVDISASNSDVSSDMHMCAVASMGQAYCWGGENRYGELGLPVGQVPTKPFLVAGLQDAASVAASERHSCALTAAGAIFCWGDNREGQLGDSTTMDRDLPAPVVGLNEPALRITAGGNADEGVTCALMTSGHVLCWGSNAYGQLASGDIARSTVPVATTISGADRIALGDTHACARVGSGLYTCWGRNRYGQVGNGMASLRGAPRRVVGLDPPPVELTAGGSHTCARLQEGSVSCWGDNRRGQLGDGSTNRRLRPGPSMKVAEQPAVAFAAGGQHSCAIAIADIYCWGYDHFGQLGVGDMIDRTTPALVSALSGHGVRIAAGTAFTCALDSAGGVECWGIGADGELGDGQSGTGVARSEPGPPVTGLDHGVVGVVTGASHACALLESGAVECWGYNGFGELGNGNQVGSAVPVAVDANALGGMTVAIASGGQHSCALLDAGTVKCWGNDAFGELGDGNAGSSQALPVLVQDLGGPAVAIAAGEHHTCAILVGGDVKCWGLNGSGQVGDGTLSDQSLPASVALPAAASVLAAGANHTCVALSSGETYCWGDASNGQLGTGDAGSFPEPQAVRGDEIFSNGFGNFQD